MAILKCKMCGGDLTLTDGASVAECEYCGTTQTVPTLDNEKKLNLFARANRLRAACEFDKAAGVYESIVSEFDEEAEAYWGLILCKYGIEYVDDPATGKKIPTCHRSSFECVLDDHNFELVMENADGMARRVYREEAKTIEELRKGIVEVSSKEEPYDIFICYKETAFDGQRTLDSVLAQDIYDALTEKGYRVFFSRVTLEDKLGQEYEPYIFAALQSAKVMLAVGTDYEHYNAVWVKNEWSRFLQLMASGQKKHLIPCFKGIDAYDMPKEFAKLQAQDLGKVGAMQDLLRGIEKILPHKAEAAVVKETVVVHQATAANPTVESYLKRAFMFLADGEWKSADEYCEKVLDIDPECADAYIGKLCINLKLANADMLSNQTTAIDNNKYYKNAVRFARGNELVKIRKYAEDIEQNIQNERIVAEEQAKKAHALAIEATYIEVLDSIQKKQSLQKYREIQKTIETLGNYKNSIELLKQCEECILEARYCEAMNIATHVGDVFALRSAVLVFEDLGNYKDAQNQITLLKQKIDQLDATRREINRLQGMIDIEYYHTIALSADGTVKFAINHGSDNIDLSSWENIVSVSASIFCILGLTTNGTAIKATNEQKRSFFSNTSEVDDWKDLVSISAGGEHAVGLKSDGTVVASGGNANCQCGVSNWRDIIQIAAAEKHTVGLRADGTVVAVGKNEHKQCNVSHWKNIIAISAKRNTTVGLQSDGNVVVTGEGWESQSEILHWKNIVQISAGLTYVLGLTSDGQVCVAYSSEHNEHSDKLEISHWTQTIVAINAGGPYAIALCDDGTILTSSKKISGCVAKWKLFSSHKNIEDEFEMRLHRKQWKNAGICQYCGGEFKGFFGKKCVNCGKSKDY